LKISLEAENPRYSRQDSELFQSRRVRRLFAFPRKRKQVGATPTVSSKPRRTGGSEERCLTMTKPVNPARPDAVERQSHFPFCP
jgi:hypothetical protein